VTVRGDGVRTWKRPLPAEQPVPRHEEPSPILTLAWDLGDQYCSARGCTQKTGLACSYIDRRERPCPTGWCPEHRYITHGAVFCPTHGRLLDGTADEFRECVRVDLGNVVPVVLAWVVQEIDAEVSATMLEVAMEWRQALVLDPVHFALVGPQRARTWERAWKICESLGPTLRVAAVIEESEPGVVEARINARPVIRLVVPWHENHGFGARPESAAAARSAALTFREQLLAALIRGIAEWRRDNIGNREPDDASLRGLAWRGSAGPTAPWVSSQHL
jgi:hypothetical protein